MPSSSADWRVATVEALRDALSRWSGTLRPLANEAIEHLDRVLHGGTGSEIAAITVPLAVFASLRGTRPPDWLLATAGATYLAWDLLDDEMDGDSPKFWSQKSSADRTIGAHLLIATAVAQPPIKADKSLSPLLVQVYLDMIGIVTEGQLRAELPLDPRTNPEQVANGIEARSGEMLGGFAEMAAVAAGADANARRAVRRFGCELAVARQLVNDLTELESARTSDLRNRTATMIGAFALQRAPVSARRELCARMHAAASDEALRHRMISGELQPALNDTRLLAKIHLAEAIRAAEAFIRHPFGRTLVDALIDYTAEVLTNGATTRGLDDPRSVARHHHHNSREVLT